MAPPGPRPGTGTGNENPVSERQRTHDERELSGYNRSFQLDQEAVMSHREKKRTRQNGNEMDLQ